MNLVRQVLRAAALMCGWMIHGLAAQTSDVEGGTDSTGSSVSGSTLLLNSTSTLIASPLSLVSAGTVVFYDRNTQLSTGVITTGNIVPASSQTPWVVETTTPTLTTAAVNSTSSSGAITLGSLAINQSPTLSISNAGASNLGLTTSSLPATGSTLQINSTFGLVAGSGASIGGGIVPSGSVNSITTTNMVVGSVPWTSSSVLNLSVASRPAVSVAGGTLTVAGGTLAVDRLVSGIDGLNLSGDALLRLRVNSAAGAEYGKFTVNGNVVLSGDLLIDVESRITSGAVLTIVEKTTAGAVSGTFTGLPEGSVVNVNGNDFKISYTGGDGNDVTLTALSRVQAWRNRNFGTSENAGASADEADFDGDGIPNLLEKAFNLDPAAGNTLPVTAAHRGDCLEYTYTRSLQALADGDVFTVEWADTLGASAWSSEGVTEQVLSDDGTVQVVKACVPAGGNGQRFMRLSVAPSAQ